MTPAWDCCCEECGQTWRDVFPEDEEGVMCPFCDSEDIDAVRVDADNQARQGGVMDEERNDGR